MNSLKIEPGYLVMTVAILFLFSCNNTKNVNSTNQKAEEELTAGSSENYKLIVSFHSFGSGIDHKMKKKFLTFLTDNYPKIIYEEINWGLEGEVDFCIQLNELNNNQKEQFVKETKELLSNSYLIHIDEDKSCRHK